MKTVNLDQYADPDVLREFSPRMLVALLDDRVFLTEGFGVMRYPQSPHGELSRHRTTIMLV